MSSISESAKFTGGALGWDKFSKAMIEYFQNANPNEEHGMLRFAFTAAKFAEKFPGSDPVFIPLVHPGAKPVEPENATPTQTKAFHSAVKYYRGELQDYLVQEVAKTKCKSHLFDHLPENVQLMFTSSSVGLLGYSLEQMMTALANAYGTLSAGDYTKMHLETKIACKSTENIRYFLIKRDAA